MFLWCLQENELRPMNLSKRWKTGPVLTSSHPGKSQILLKARVGVSRAAAVMDSDLTRPSTAVSASVHNVKIWDEIVRKCESNCCCRGFIAVCCYTCIGLVPRGLEFYGESLHSYLVTVERLWNFSLRSMASVDIIKICSKFSVDNE